LPASAICLRCAKPWRAWMPPSKTGMCLELFAEELRLAQDAVNEITGEFTPDDLLGVIFSRFCIGK
jgi:tRNA U34 5-carboxymethylaminomethyl modifying GTPase MnmE/TrmE